MRRFIFSALIALLASSAVAVTDYDRGVAAFNRGDKVQAELALQAHVGAEGEKAQPMALLILGELAKGRGEHAKSSEWYAKAAKAAKAGSKIRCSALRCLIYSRTKAWTDAGVAEGDGAADVLAKEYATDGDAGVARATWWNRRGFELVKAGDAAGAVPLYERSVAARQDFPKFGNNLAVAYCELGEASKGSEARAWAQKALDLVARYNAAAEPKLTATKERAQAILARAK